MVFGDNGVQISALRVAKLSRRYFAKDRFPFSCLQVSIARRIAPIETIATIRSESLRWLRPQLAHDCYILLADEVPQRLNCFGAQYW